MNDYVEGISSTLADIRYLQITGWSGDMIIVRVVHIFFFPGYGYGGRIRVSIKRAHSTIVHWMVCHVCIITGVICTKISVRITLRICRRWSRTVIRWLIGNVWGFVWSCRVKIRWSVAGVVEGIHKNLMSLSGNGTIHRIRVVDNRWTSFSGR